MRLHRLEVEAFGPFAHRIDVDFDTLSSAGLFLLSGATGAGKTSVLDAVCFALYGDVPGDRSAAKRLRCDQAPPDVAPRVLLEVSLGQRRFRIERTPSWERRKRRGTGMTKQQASVTLSELCDSEWVPLSSRLDETGDLVRRLVGMNLAQFTQVAMLPQGRFQTFLRAKSDERHQLLQQLFRTGRFAEVERWLRDRRVTLSRADVATHQQVADVVSRISEAVGLPLPDSWDIHDLRNVADQRSLAPWASELVEQTQADLRAHREEVAISVRLEAEARQALDDARALAAGRARYQGAQRERHLLDERSDKHESDRRRLEAARRAAGVVPLQRHARAGATAAAALRRQAAAAFSTAAAHLGLVEPASPAQLADLADRAVVTAADSRSMLPRVARQKRARAESAQVERRLGRLASELATARNEEAVMPERLTALRDAVADAATARERLSGLAETQETLRSRLIAHDEVARLRVDVQDARQEWLDARETTVRLKEELISLQQARIEGMAAELAGALASGCNCPVCGSAVHPAMASAAPGAPDAQAEKGARARADDSSMIEHAFDAKVRELEASLAGALARAGEAPADVTRDRLASARDQHAAATRAAGAHDTVLADLAGAETAQARLSQLRSDLAEAHARAQAEKEALDLEIEGLGAEIDAVLADTSHDDLPSLLAHSELSEALCRDAVARHRQADDAERAHRNALAAVTAAAVDAGFADAEDAASQALPSEDVEDLARAIDEHRRRLAVVLEILGEPGAEELASAPPPALDSLEAAHTTALAQRDRAASALHATGTRQQRLAGLVEDLEHVITPWAPLRDDLALTTRLAGFVEGKSADNQLKMRLSAYVLAYRLSQVVAAANERLASMSDQRYSLEHTGQRGAGETRGGLSLLVRDDWSGETRDPATLSGGETFVVSLALALGLADVVVHESGGAALDTLFVDEGFGSLDADTLDDVMDTLDSLRDGGRVVGLVSHVAEMRDRIPSQLVVTKARGGSTVRLRGC